MKFSILSFSWIFALIFSFQSKTSDALVLVCVDDNTFTGTTSTDWNTTSNWSAGCVPGDGTITGTITIASNCTVGSGDGDDYTFGTGGNLVIQDGVTFTNNGTGTWTIAEIKGNGTYAGDLTMDGNMKPGLDCYAGLHPAFSDFDTDNFTIYVSGTDVVIETNGLPNHTSPYWSAGHPLYVAPPAGTTGMSPGNIDNFNGTYTMTVPMNPALAASSSATGLSAIGMAVSGSVIYNDEEGPNVPLIAAVGSLDYTGAHTGPQSYHYHLEPNAWSDDDDKLIGIIADGFFIYGRQCQSTGTYPTDLDDSGGHTSRTQHCSEEYYHYHIQNDLYLGAYYIIFPDDYQGTPVAIQ